MIDGLELDCEAAPHVQNMDITPDLSFFFSSKLLAFLNWEDKKGIGDKVWENDSSVAGQVFEHLMLTKCGVGGAAFGILSTYNGFKLVSTEDWTKIPPAVLLPQNVTPDKCLPPVGPSAAALQASVVEQNPLKTSPKAKKHPAIRTIPRIAVDKDAPRTPKETRITARHLKREFFASKTFELGIKDATDMEEKNKAVILLICATLQVAQESMKCPKADLRSVPFDGVCRVFELGSNLRIYPGNVRIDAGIQFDRRPTAQHSIFYSLTQVGSGATAVCCLAVAADASICALKIFRETGKYAKEAAEAELKNWEKIYEDRNWTFMKFVEIDSALILVLPFFDVPGNAVSRASFLVGADEDTLLWKALDGFAARGYAHNDLTWHHIGTLTCPTKKRTNDEKSTSTTEAFLLDLGNITKMDGLLEFEKRTAWVREQFDKMKWLAGI